MRDNASLLVNELKSAAVTLLHGSLQRQAKLVCYL